MKTNSKFRHHPQMPMNFGEIVVDNFAGGGGASTGIEQAVGRAVDIAINHDLTAISMHEVNHPHTAHYCESVWDIDPREVTTGRPVGLAWFSPDCRHFSKAKGKKPVSKKVRGLAWVVLKWIGAVRPRVIMLENVEEFLTWGPLIENERGELVPDPARKGQTFNAFVKAIRRHGYIVDWKELRACDFGAPTIRKRLFLVARCDGQPIKWPKPTHGPGLKPYRTAAEIIDWSIPCSSIFDRKKPLAENTLKRIAEGLRRFVIEHPEPFILNITHGGRVNSLREPLRTITTAKRGEKAVVMPVIERQFSASAGNSAKEPLGTVTAGGGGKSALVAAFLAKHYGGVVGHGVERPIGAVTAIDHHSLVTSHLIKLRGSCKHGQQIDKPLPTITAGGNHIGEVRAFLMKYYSEGGQWQDVRDPVHTVPTKARLGLVTVRGVDYQIVDIGMRMLQPHELYAAQGFPQDYIFDRDAHGKPFTKEQQIAKCGNSVCPPVVAALVHANYSAQATVETRSS
jgi:DNA (cytosine-5)-methyltransferase 1